MAGTVLGAGWTRVKKQEATAELVFLGGGGQGGHTLLSPSPFYSFMLSAWPLWALEFVTPDCFQAMLSGVRRGREVAEFCVWFRVSILGGLEWVGKVKRKIKKLQFAQSGMFSTK